MENHEVRIQLIIKENLSQPYVVTTSMELVPDSFLPRLSYNIPVSICLLDKLMLVLNNLCYLRMTSSLLSRSQKRLRILQSEFQLPSEDSKFAFPFIMLPTTGR